MRHSVFDDMAGYLLKRVNFVDGGCYLWRGQKDKDGYGQFRKQADDHWQKAHRVSWRTFIGSIPRGLNVLHKCDVPGCINPPSIPWNTKG